MRPSADFLTNRDYLVIEVARIMGVSHFVFEARRDG